MRLVGYSRIHKYNKQERVSVHQVHDEITFAITNLQQLQVFALGVQKNGPISSRYGWRWGSEGLL